MKDKHKIETNQLPYLQTLINQHTNSVGHIHQYIQEVNTGYQQKILQGEYTIKRGHFQKSSSHNHHEFRQLKHYLTQKEQLQKMKRSLDKNTKQQSRGSVLSDEQRLNFIKKIKQKQKQLSQQKERHIKIRQIEQRQREQQSKMMKEFQESERKHSKRKQIERRLEELNEEKERKLQQLRQRNKEFNQIKNQKTLIQKLEQNFHQQQMGLLQQKKRKLSQIREIHKPMSKTQFQQHMSRIVEYKKTKEQIKMRESQVKQMSPQSTNQFYKSHWYKNVIKEQKIDEEKLAQDQKQALRQLKDKEKKYAEYIKQNYVPDTDDKLTDQIEKRIKTPIKRKKPKQIRQMGLENLKVCKEKAISKQQLQEKKKNELERQSTRIEKHKDYLKDLKKLRSSSLTELKLQIIGGTEKQKLQTLKIYAQQLEYKAKQKIQLQKIKKGLFDSEADQLYMKALNAKLSLIPKQ